MSLTVYLQAIDEDGNEIEVYSDNITHNLVPMAKEVGCYYALWHPEEKGWERARDILPCLRRAANKLFEKADYYAYWNAKNGWGTQGDLLGFVRRYRDACEKYPSSRILASG